jgi:hypothetical protein
MLGDDNVMSLWLALKYEEGMEALHIPLQQSKTFKTEDGRSFEYCKRLFRSGVEVTPLP